MSRRLRWILGGVLGLAVVVGHWAFWYSARLHPSRPEPGSLTLRLLESESFPAAVWVPFPHQNLARLETATPNAQEVLAAAARLAGLPPPNRPAFGPLRLPPATSMTLAGDEENDRYALAAEVYPAVAVFARLAGRLAGNPWLEGGEILDGGRRVEVAWRGNAWTVASPGWPFPESPSRDATAVDLPASEKRAAPSLMVAAVREASEDLPAGRYRLTVDGGGVTVQSDRPVPEELALEGRSFGDRDGPFLLTLRGRRSSDSREGADGLAYFSQDDNLELPRMAVISEPDSGRRSLPGENILGIARRPRTLGIAGWNVTAFQTESLERGAALVPRLEPLIGEESGGRLASAVWVDLDAGLVEIDRVIRILDRVRVLLSRRRLERWNDIRTVLAAFARSYSRFSLVVTRDDALRLRLVRRGHPS